MLEDSVLGPEVSPRVPREVTRMAARDKVARMPTRSATIATRKGILGRIASSSRETRKQDKGQAEVPLVLHEHRIRDRSG